MSRTEEQRLFIKFCAKDGKTATETLNLIREIFGADAKSKSRVFDWHKRFKIGCDSIADYSRSGRPKTVTNEEKIKQIKELATDESKSIRQIAKEAGISHCSCQIILNQLGIRQKKGNKKKEKKVKKEPFQHFLLELIEN